MTGGASGGEDESIGALLGRLVEDGKGYARAEIGYYRTLVTTKAAEASTGIGLGFAALVIAWSALTALLVGLVLTLATLVGPGWATLIVFGVSIGLAGLLGWLAYRHFMRVFGGKA